MLNSLPIFVLCVSGAPLPQGTLAAAVRWPDWLIDPSPYTARVVSSEDFTSLTLTNGLLRRTFRLVPNAATVGLDQPVTGQVLLRGVKPEAVVAIDGLQFEVGGLKGQPNYAYLQPDWEAGLTADPEALLFVGHEIGKPKERFQWKRLRHHAPEARWPPAGVYLRMDYRLPSVALEKLAGSPRPSEEGRERWIRDDFQELTDKWRLHTSGGHVRSSFANEGKIGEIHTPANTAVFVERSLPPETRIVEAVIDVGTDRSASWGPGIALVWDDQVIKFHFRPGGEANNEAPLLGVYDGNREITDVSGGRPLDISRPWTLRLRVEDKSVFCDAKPRGGNWETYHTVRRGRPVVDPKAVRVGKMDLKGGATGFSEPGDLVRVRILEFSAYGPRNARGTAQLTARRERLGRLRVSVHYELYDGIPCYSKWLTVNNPSDGTITVDSFTSEILAVVERASAVEDRNVGFPVPDIHVETDYAFGGFTPAQANRLAVHWVPDPDYHTQVNYLKRTPCLLEVRPLVGPAQDVPPGGTFESFRTFVLPYDSTERERQGLALRRMYRTVAPWVTENPLMMHVRFADWNTVKNAIDQCADVGFEMVILTFGSGFNIENESPEYLAEMKRYAEYARSRGVEIGGYSLLASRRIHPLEDNCVDPATGKPGGGTFGFCPALASAWGQDYFRKLYRFYRTTGFTLLEHDGSYPGDLDAAARPPLQKGAADSRWAQWRIITDFYKFCRGEGIYLNVPDYYYLSGSTKCGMGYRETNWSLPRPQQVIHTRQNIFDGTWQKTPSMGWMFVPLTQYHGGGASATIEPLDEHRDHYERMLCSNLAFGVQACYRGPRIYDTARTRDLVKKWVDWFKSYRPILESDLVHGRRADGRDLDWMLHVNPKLRTKGLLVVFNPLPKALERTIPVNLYYTGLTRSARVRESEREIGVFQLARDYTIDLTVRVEPTGMSWYLIE